MDVLTLTKMRVEQLIVRFISLVILTQFVSAYLSNLDDELVLIDEGPGKIKLVFTS